MSFVKQIKEKEFNQPNFIIKGGFSSVSP